MREELAVVRLAAVFSALAQVYALAWVPLHPDLWLMQYFVMELIFNLFTIRHIFKYGFLDPPNDVELTWYNYIAFANTLLGFVHCWRYWGAPYDVVANVARGIALFDLTYIVSILAPAVVLTFIILWARVGMPPDFVLIVAEWLVWRYDILNVLPAHTTPTPHRGLTMEEMKLLIHSQPRTPITESCPICMCCDKNRQDWLALPCRHLYHGICILTWLNTTTTCPMCIQDVTRGLFVVMVDVQANACGNVAVQVSAIVEVSAI